MKTTTAIVYTIMKDRSNSNHYHDYSDTVEDN